MAGSQSQSEPVAGLVASLVAAILVSREATSGTLGADEAEMETRAELLRVESTIELSERDLTSQGTAIRLGEFEARLLATLASSAGNRCSYNELNQAVYGDEFRAEYGADYARITGPLKNLAEELRKKFLLLLGTNILANEARFGYYLRQSIIVKTEFPFDASLCPYRGLEVFHEEDAPFFVGREAFADDLHRVVNQQNLVALVGSSGSGKSSIVQAGLIPLLRCNRPPQTTWEALTFAPGDDPFFSLASKLIPVLRPDLGPTELMTERRKLAASLADESVPLQDPLDDLRRRLNHVDRLLLVVDQFEELFTLTPEELRQVFVRTLLRLTPHDGVVCVLLTLRADFYDQAIGLSRALSDQLGRAVVNVGTMSRDELMRAVVEPATRVGLRFQPGLVETILEDIDERVAALPLLEFALLQLWQKRSGRELTLEAYRTIGGVSGALAKQAQATYTRLGIDEQAIARRVLLRLVVPGEASNHTRQRVPMADLLSREDAAQVGRVVKVLADARLLMTSTDPLSAARSVDISHEALIRSWDEFNDWIGSEREWLREHRRLTDATRDWKQRGDEELLYRGSRLADVMRLQAQHLADLSREEEDFLARSQRLEARRERARYLGQASGGAVGVALGYGIAFAAGFAMTNPGPNALILASATFVFLFAVGQATGFAMGITLWLGHTHSVGRCIATLLAGGVVSMIGYLLYLRFLVNAEPNLARAAVGASLGIGIGLGLAVSRTRWRRFSGATFGGAVGTVVAVSIGGITWGVPVTIASGLALGALSGAGFLLTSAEDHDRAG